LQPIKILYTGGIKLSELEKSLLEAGYKQLGEPHNNVKTIYKIFEDGGVYLFSFKGDENVGCVYLSKEQFKILKSK
jgi:hypothetical protein